MAEPLTSSDIWRIQRGFGVSELASPEEKKRFADAGVAPLTTGARQRFEEGRGISPMAGATEKEAWVAAEVMAGQRDPMELPKTYGGLGERPEASTRRGLRMQQEWDAQYKMLIDQQEAARQADMEEKRYAIDVAREERQRRAEEASIDVAYAKEMRDLEIEKQSDRAMKSIIGTTLPNGQRTRPINVNEDDAVERIQSVVASNPYGMESQIVKETVSMMLNDALNVRQSKIDQSKQQELAAANLSARTLKPMSEFGEYNEQGIFKPNIKGMITGAEEVKKAEEAKALESTIATERRRTETAADVAEERDKKSRRRQLDEDILTEEQTLIDFQNQKQSPTRDTEIKKSEAKLKNFHLRRGAIEGLTSDDLIYKDQDTYKKAIQEGKKIPSGTTIYIGGIPAKVK